MNASPIVRVENIFKSFPGVHALKDVSLVIHPGEIHALVGENGSGKSTLMKIIAGVYKADRGTLEVDGADIGLWSPRIAQQHGIAVIYQELSLFPDLSIAENIFVGHGKFTCRGIVQWKSIESETKRLLQYLKVDSIEPRDRVESLSIAHRQVVEIAKALAAIQSRVLIMDEPTSALSQEETSNLFTIMRQLKSDGVGIVFISHKLHEIFAVTDRVTVLRDGEVIGSHPTAAVSEDELVRMMIGRDLADVIKRKSNIRPDVIFEVEGLTKGGVFQDISFSLRAGEILGIFGLVGAKRTEVAQALFGILKPTEGKVKVRCKAIRFGNSKQARDLGIGLIPEDRATQGLVLDMDIKSNTVLTILDRLFPSSIMNKRVESEVAKKTCSDLEIRYGSLDSSVDSLSGGNKQKVVLAKWLLTDANVLILDEPTKGIDVGAKEVIYQLMNDLTEKGIGIIMISSELPEILKMSDRIVVMSQGRLSGSFDIRDANQDALLRCASRLVD